MANFFYFDANGNKNGPHNEQQLQTLAAQGIITPSTPLETDGGHKGTAGQVPGLKFNAAVPPPPAQTSQVAPQAGGLFCTNCGVAVSDQSVACMSCGAKPVGHRKFCRQCGTGLNSEQVICTKCGAGIGAATSKVVQSTHQQAFCTNCGSPVSEQAVACMSCGAKPVGHRKFCRQCGIALNPEQIVCVKCGAGVGTAGASRSGGGEINKIMAAIGGSESKNKIVAAILAFFLGTFGVHWFYLGEKKKAITYLSVCLGGIVLSIVVIGIFAVLVIAILALVDAVKLLMMSDEDFDMKYNS